MQEENQDTSALCNPPSTIRKIPMTLMAIVRGFVFHLNNMKTHLMTNGHIKQAALVKLASWIWPVRSATSERALTGATVPSNSVCLSQRSPGGALPEDAIRAYFQRG
jgi:hypothetical protein